MTKYFIIGASKDHATKGVEGGFAQAGHGREDLLSRLSKGDWIVYYSSKDTFEKGPLIQKFTAVGKVSDEEPYQITATKSFKPFRRAVDYENIREAEIRPLLDRLSFITNKKRWGFYLMSGFKEISKEDFDIIKTAMR